MAAPSTALDMTRTYSGASAVIHYKGGEQKTVPLEYHVLYHNTDKVGSNPYEAGRLYDAFGNALTDPFGAPLIAETPDGTSLFAIPGAPSSPSGEASLYLVTQYEYDWLLSDGSEASDTEGWYSRAPSAMNLTTLAQDPTSGALTAEDQYNIDFSGVGGLWIPCAASQTPWNTHLAGEEDYDFFRRDLVDASVADMTELYFRNTTRRAPTATAIRSRSRSAPTAAPRCSSTTAWAMRAGRRPRSCPTAGPPTMATTGPTPACSCMSPTSPGS